MNTTVIFCVSQSSLHLVDHAPALFGAHAGGRLVEQQHLGFEHQRQRDIEQLLVAMRQRRRGAVALAGQPQQFHRVLGAVAGLGQRKAPMQHAGAALIGADRGQHGLVHRQRRKNARDLKRAADAVAHDLGRRAPGHIDAVEQDLTGIRLQRAGDQVEERALAGAVRADHGGERTVGKIERDVVGRLDAAERFGEPADLQHG